MVRLRLCCCYQDPAGKTLLFLLCIGFAAGDFHAPASHGSHQDLVWLVIGVVLAAAVLAGVVTLVPRILPPVWGWLTLVWMRHREYL